MSGSNSLGECCRGELKRVKASESGVFWSVVSGGEFKAKTNVPCRTPIGHSRSSRIVVAGVQSVESAINLAVIARFAPDQMRPTETVFPHNAGKMSRSGAPSKSCLTL